MCTHTLSLSRSCYSFIKMFHNHHHDDVDAGSGSCHRTKQETEKSWKNEWACLRPSLTFSCIFLQATEWMIFKSSTISPTTTSWRGERRASTLSSWPFSSRYGLCLFLSATPPPPPPPTKDPLGLKVFMADLLWVFPTVAEVGRYWSFPLTLRNRVWFGELDLASVAFFNFSDSFGLCLFESTIL